MAYTAKNVSNTLGTAKEYKATSDKGALNIAKELSVDFHGVYAAMQDGKAFAYFREGRKFKTWADVRKSYGAIPSHTVLSFA
jgi:hypothetical protein